MNTLQVTNEPLQQLPPEEDISKFKVKVRQWLTIDEEIAKHEKRIRELRKIKNQQLEPEITGFMRQFNISDLNTDNGKIRCNVRNTKQCLNKTNIRDNLSKIMTSEHDLNSAMDMIVNNRTVVTTYKLTKPKR